MQQYNEQEQFLKKKGGKTDLLTLGDPSVLSLDPLIHDCNPTTLHGITHLQREGANVDPVSFFFVSYKRHIK